MHVKQLLYEFAAKYSQTLDYGPILTIKQLLNNFDFYMFKLLITSY